MKLEMPYLIQFAKIFILPVAAQGL